MHMIGYMVNSFLLLSNHRYLDTEISNETSIITQNSNTLKLGKLMQRKSLKRVSTVKKNSIPMSQSSSYSILFFVFFNLTDDKKPFTNSLIRSIKKIT